MSNVPQTGLPPTPVHAAKRLTGLARFFHGLGRVFTVPKADRALLEANPLVMAAKNRVLDAAMASAKIALAQEFPGNVLVQDVAAHEILVALSNTGVLK